jgi:CheY-like chemotaxis protein
MAKMLRRVLPHSVELELTDDPSPGCIHADPGQVEQVILNLVVNSGDAMPLGGTLTVQTSNVAVGAEEAAELEVPPGPFVMLRVRDTGIGMSAQTRQRIFEPFFTTKGEGKGTGLGLPTVLGIVRQSGGAIRVQSAPGHGATFEVYFPRSAGDAPKATERHVRWHGPKGHGTVLLVDDDDQVRALAQTILRRAGYDVLEAATPGEALLIAEQHTGSIDLLITDVVMPRLSGTQLAGRLAALRGDMSVLYMSGRLDDALVSEAVAESGAVFIPKPITPEVLTRKVREALAG